MGEWLQVESTESRAYLATPAGGRGPGVLVLHAWWGLTPVFTDVCDRLAAAGFVALAPDLYLDGASADTIPEAEALRDKHDAASEQIAALIRSATAQLRAMPNVTGDGIGTIGFSLGAYWALQLSQWLPDDVRAVVAVYGTDDGDYQGARAAYLAHFAENDAYEPLDWVRNLEERIRSAGCDLAVHIYPNTSHWFVEPNRDVYDPEAAALVWQRTLAFFQQHLTERRPPMDLLDRLLGYDDWATTRVLDYCADLTDAQLDQPFDIGQHTLRETLHHMIYVIDGWTAQMTGQPLPPGRAGRPTLAELREQHERYQSVFAAAARQAQAEGRLSDVFRDHHRFPQSVGSTILQVLTHNVQHRAEARHILERLGVANLWDLDPQEWEHEAGYVPNDIAEENA